MKSERRKVLLWSRQPWRQVDTQVNVNLPSGRFVAGRTRSSLGDVDVIGVCVPWAGAHVRTGRRDRELWEDHTAYLSRLEPLLKQRTRRTLIMGDYNQRIPRTTAPERVYRDLQAAILSRFAAATAGAIAPLHVQVIDHVSHTSDLKATATRSLSNLDQKGKQMTDHVGVQVMLKLAS